MDKVREAIALVVTVGLAAIVFIPAASYLLNPSVAIAVIVAAGGVFAYVKGRLDETISLLDDIAGWTIYSYYGTYLPDLQDTEYLKEITKENTNKLAAASARAASRLPIDVFYAIADHTALLHLFSVKSFDSNDETRDWTRLMIDSSRNAHGAITDLEQNEYRMRYWGPRWLANKYEDLLGVLLRLVLRNKYEKKHEELLDWIRPREIPMAVLVIMIMFFLAVLVVAAHMLELF